MAVISMAIDQLRTARARCDAAERSGADDREFDRLMRSLVRAERRVATRLTRGGVVVGDSCWAVVEGRLVEIPLGVSHA